MCVADADHVQRDFTCEGFMSDARAARGSALPTGLLPTRKATAARSKQGISTADSRKCTQIRLQSFGASALAMPVTSTRLLGASSGQKIQQLASQVFEDGAVSSKACPGTGIPTVNTFHIFYITEGGATRSFSAPGPCDTAEAAELQHVLYCSARPAGYGCAKQKWSSREPATLPPSG